MKKEMAIYFGGKKFCDKAILQLKIRLALTTY